jgi:predicted lipoprotein with Yx(FWY)xxD motif
MKRILIPVALVAVAAIGASTSASARPTGPVAGAAGVATVRLGSSSLGRILVDRHGGTLYNFTKDSRDKDTCVPTRGCTGLWPPFTTTGKPIAGQGVKASLLGTIKLPHGVEQVTYDGRPLYTYDGDATGSAYVGAHQFGGYWYAFNAAGRVMR